MGVGQDWGALGLIFSSHLRTLTVEPSPREPDQPPLLPPKKEKMKRKVRPVMLRIGYLWMQLGMPGGSGGWGRED